MIYILNANLKDTQPLWRALCKVYGINSVLSSQICDDLGISRKVKTNQLLPSQIDLLNQVVPQDYLTGAELHSQGLPTRGQRTHGNAQTSRARSIRVSGGGPQRRTPSKRRNS